MQSFTAPVHELGEEGEANVSDSEGQPAFVRSGCTLGDDSRL